MAEVQAPEYDRLVHERDGYRCVSEEAMKLMTDAQLIALRHRLDELDREQALVP